MIMLILGLLIFLGIHCVGFAPEWRQRRVDSMGLLPWKGLYSLIALAGFVLIVLGFQQARLDPVVLYAPPGRRRVAAGPSRPRPRSRARCSLRHRP